MGINKSARQLFTRILPFSRRDPNPSLTVSRATDEDQEIFRTKRAGYGPVRDYILPKGRKPPREKQYLTENLGRRSRKPKLKRPRKTGSEVND